MTLTADRIAVQSKFETVRVVAITARHAGMKHPALNERAVLINFTLDLAVTIIKIIIEQCDPIVITQWLAMLVVFMYRAAS